MMLDLVFHPLEFLMLSDMKRLLENIALVLSLFALTQCVHAQCSTDQHSNHPEDSWQSCSASLLPDGSAETAHWILYDLGVDYYITNLHYWNYNVYGSTENGFQNVEIRVSEDYNTWSTVGTFSLEQAMANNQYLGETLAVDGFSARYVLLIAHSNYGGDCYGISEVRFDLGDEPEPTGLDSAAAANGINLFPNPSNGNFRVDLREYNGTELNVMDVYGRVLLTKDVNESDFVNVNLKGQSSGAYFVQLIDGNSVRTEKVLLK